MKSNCESCGKENPETCDGYTCCCNELVCDGPSQFGLEKFHHEKSGEFVKACCWAKAEIAWVKKYGHRAPNGSCMA